MAEIIFDSTNPVVQVQPTYRYLGVVGLITNKSAELFFSTDEHEYNNDEESLQQLYKKRTDLTAKNSISVHTICPRSLG